jgi:hypothetical protein
MKKQENNLEELSYSQLLEISGGGFWYDLGVSAHNAWNSAANYLETHSFKAHSRQAI